MRSAEASAKTRQEAIQKALESLGAELHEVEIEILDEGSKGLFGFGAREVRVRVSCEGEDPRHRERGRRPARQEARHERTSEKPARHDRGPRPERQPKPEKHAPKHETRPPRQEKVERTERADRPRESVSHKENQQEREPLAPISDERREEAAALLREIITKMGIEATISSSAMGDGGARINVESPDSAILIGRKGRTLQSLQYILNRMMRPIDAPETTERIIVDVESYLDRRKESLEEMARQLAQRAKETGREVRAKPLSPQERRIIHLTLQEDPEVRTFSLGSGSIRTVVVAPKNAGRDGSRPRRDRGGPHRRDRRRGGDSGRHSTPQRPSDMERDLNQGDAAES